MLRGLLQSACPVLGTLSCCQHDAGNKPPGARWRQLQNHPHTGRLHLSFLTSLSLTVPRELCRICRIPSSDLLAHGPPIGPSPAPGAACSGPGHRLAYLGPKAERRHQHRQDDAPKEHRLRCVSACVLQDFLLTPALIRISVTSHRHSYRAVLINSTILMGPKEHCLRCLPPCCAPKPPACNSNHRFLALPDREQMLP